MPIINLHVPDSLLVRRAISVEEVTKESQFVLASYLYQKGYLNSDAAADMCGMSRADFLLTMERSSIPVADPDGEDEDNGIRGIHNLSCNKEDKENLNNLLRKLRKQLITKIPDLNQMEISEISGSGKSGAKVFRLRLVLLGTEIEPHGRIIKYDKLLLIKQEQVRYNTFVSNKQQCSFIFCQEIDEPIEKNGMAILVYRDLNDLKQGVGTLEELIKVILDLTKDSNENVSLDELFHVLDDVLGGLYNEFYKEIHCDNISRTIKWIFADILPPKISITNNSEKNERISNQGYLVDIEADSNGYYREKYIIEETDRQGKITDTYRIDCFCNSDSYPKSYEESKRAKVSFEGSRGTISESLEATIKRYFDQLKDVFDSAELQDNIEKRLYEELDLSLDCSFFANRLHHDLNPGNILVATYKKQDGGKKEIKAYLIDYASFGAGGHIFTDLARLEALILIESIINSYNFNGIDYGTVKENIDSLENSLFYFKDSDDPIVKIAIRIREIGLKWLKNENGIDEKHYLNYLYARYVFLLKFLCIKKGDKFLETKKKIALLFAEKLQDNIKNERAGGWNKTKKILEKRFKNEDRGLSVATLKPKTLAGLTILGMIAVLIVFPRAKNELIYLILTNCLFACVVAFMPSFEKSKITYSESKGFEFSPKYFLFLGILLIVTNSLTSGICGYFLTGFDAIIGGLIGVIPWILIHAFFGGLLSIICYIAFDFFRFFLLTKDDDTELFLENCDIDVKKLFLLFCFMSLLTGIIFTPAGTLVWYFRQIESDLIKRLIIENSITPPAFVILAAFLTHFMLSTLSNAHIRNKIIYLIEYAVGTFILCGLTIKIVGSVGAMKETDKSAFLILMVFVYGIFLILIYRISFISISYFYKFRLNLIRAISYAISLFRLLHIYIISLFRLPIFRVIKILIMLLFVLFVCWMLLLIYVVRLT